MVQLYWWRVIRSDAGMTVTGWTPDGTPTRFVKIETVRPHLEGAEAIAFDGSKVTLMSLAHAAPDAVEAAAKAAIDEAART